MLLALFLTTPTPPPASAWQTVGTVLAYLLASAAALEKVYGWIFGGTSKRLDSLEKAVKEFVPEGDIKAKNTELGQQIGELQGKIKAYHDGAEGAINALAMRTSSLEQHNTSLTLLPGEVNNLKTDHRVLSSKVDTLTNSVEKLGDKQDKHFSDLMQAVERLAFTRGEMHAGQRRPLPPGTYELPPS